MTTPFGFATSRIYSEGRVAAQVPAVADYLAVMATRPAAQKVSADRAQALEAFFGARKP